jgi:hypothetical protein
VVLEYLTLNCRYVPEEPPGITSPNLNKIGHTSPSFTTILSLITPPAATIPPDSTFAWRTVAPIDMKLLSPSYEPWIVEFGPTNTLLPILIYRDRWQRSWITQPSPMVIFLVPISTAPYHTDELVPMVTLPTMVALGAMNSAASISGLKP